MAVLDVLVSHHLLVRTGGAAAAISFQHQQFQEWYASFEVEALMRKAGPGDGESRSKLRERPLKFAHGKSRFCSLASASSRADGDGERAVASAILDSHGNWSDARGGNDLSVVSSCVGQNQG